MTTRDEILAACEERADCAAQLLIAADWFAEHDEPEMERAMRWMAKWDRRPTNLKSGEGRANWLWTCFGGIREGVPHSTLPRTLCKKMGFWEWKCWYDWWAAVECLAMGLNQLPEVECVGDPTQPDAATIAEMDIQNEDLITQLRAARS